MKRLLLSLLTLIAFNSNAGEIASVNFSKIEDDLRTWFLSLPENVALSDRYQSTVAGDEQRQKMLKQSMAKAREEGEKADLSEYFQASSNTDGYKFKRELKEQLKKELFLLTQKMNLDYAFIYDSSSSDPVIYAAEGIDDITPLIRQHLLTLMKDITATLESDRPERQPIGPEKVE
ncbi:MAG: hypothetical protein CMO55_26410 [Verrucomicrobiales bacterium]|nr:hypothetical protein [Verrucomicrobiales bacterium]